MRRRDALIMLSAMGMYPFVAKGQDKDRSMKLGLIWSDTGPAAAFGKLHHDGTMLAIDEINESGGILGHPIEPYHLDDRTDPTVGIDAAKRLIARNKVDAIIGSSASLVTIAFARVNEENKVPLINAMAGSPKVTGQGFKYSWRILGNANQETEQLAELLLKNPKFRRFACIAENSDYGIGPANAFADRVRKLGGEVTAFELENRGDNDFKPQLSKIKASNPDVIFIQTYYIEAGIIARQARELGIKAQFSLCSGLGFPEFSKLAGDAAAGALYVSNWSPLFTDDKSVKFRESFKKKWGYVPSSGMEAVCYDTVHVVAEAARLGGGVGRQHIQDGLGKLNAEDFKILLGTVNFDENNQNRVQIHLGVFKEDGSPVPLDVPVESL